MQRLSTTKLRPGMITAEDVFNFDNLLIAPNGTVLTDKIITRLTFYSIPSIKIKSGELEDNETPISVEDSTISISGEEPITLSNKIKNSEDFKVFTKEFEQSVSDVENSINDIVKKGAEINTQELLSQTKLFFQESKSSTDYFLMMQNMRQYDDATFTHCMNVALICKILTGWIGFSEEEQKLATLCGLLHDIGKLAIPDEIIKKPTKLTEDEFKIVQTHPIEGYNILKNQSIDVHIKNSALMHHEKCDGSGYPLAVSSNKIDRFAKIVAIADVYDAMTAARVYRGPLCPFQVIEVFEREGLQKYDTNSILTFLQHVATTYLHNNVRLSDGRIGEIVFINQNHYSKPYVQCGNNVIDIGEIPNLSIEEIL